MSNTDFLKEKLLHEYNEITETMDRKQGPQDIGVVTDYQKPDYGLGRGSETFLKEKLLHAYKETDGEVERKLGPRDIGRNEEYKVT
eukprot:UN19498